MALKTDYYQSSVFVMELILAVTVNLFFLQRGYLPKSLTYIRLLQSHFPSYGTSTPYLDHCPSPYYQYTSQYYQTFTSNSFIFLYINLSS